MIVNKDLDGIAYTARREYLADDVVQRYMTDRFSGPLGRYRYRREQAAVSGMIRRVPPSEIAAILDCPTGTGRWLPLLASLRPNRVVAVDVSPAMLKKAQTVPLDGIAREFHVGVAEQLPFADNQFDLVFCHALFKHLPEQVQMKVIAELARVTSKYVILAASVRRGPAGVLRRVRKAGGAHSMPRRRFEQIALQSGLRVIGSRKATTPIGNEYSYLFRKA